MSEITAVHTIMTRGVETIGPEQSVSHAWGRMLELGVRHLPVIQGGKLIGMLSDRDLLRSRLNSAEASVHPDEALAGDVMTRDVLTIRPDAHITDAARLMIDNKVSALPVLDYEGALVGLITTEDMLKLAVDFDYLVSGVAQAPSR